MSSVTDSRPLRELIAEAKAEVTEEIEEHKEEEEEEETEARLVSGYGTYWSLKMCCSTVNLCVCRCEKYMKFNTRASCCFIS